MRFRSPTVFEILTALGLAALGVAILLPSFTLYVQLENATSSPLTVASIETGTRNTRATMIDPGERKRLKVFSGDGDQERMVFVIIASTPSGAVVHTSRHTARDLHSAQLIVLRDGPAASMPATQPNRAN